MASSPEDRHHAAASQLIAKPAPMPAADAGEPTAHSSPAPRPPRTRRRWARRLLQTPVAMAAATSLTAGYLRLVNATSRLSFDPVDPYGRYFHLAPVIFAMWHGQHFMLPFTRIFEFDVRVLVSRTSDGEMNARVAEKLGIGTIRGSAARTPARMIEKGGLSGFLEMKAALEGGACVAMTADISNLTARRAGLGVALLGKMSGRAIVPIAYASSRRISVNSWDRASINLPFSRACCAVAEPITVPRDAGDELLEQKRREVEDALNAATKRAYDLVDRR